MASWSRIGWSVCLVMGCAPSPAARQVTTSEPPAPASSAAPAWMAPPASFPSVERALATCSPDGGYVLLGAPHDKATDVRIDVAGVERVTWPDGSLASSVTFETTRRDGTYEARVVVVGRATTAWPLRAPNDRGIGELADIGIVAQWVSLGGVRYIHTRHLPPSGWYPLGAKAAYLQVRRDNTEAGWQENADVVLELRAVMGPDGIAIHPMPNHAPATTWALVGPAPMPAWCAQKDARVRCGELQVPGSFVTPDTSWIAGVWATPSDAMNAARALGVDPKSARWMAIDPPQRQRVVTGPDGRSAIGLLQLTRKPLPPPPPPRR